MELSPQNSPSNSARDLPASLSIPASASGKNALEVGLAAARAAGDVIRSRFNTVKDVNFKGRANVVTDVDLLAEGRALDLIRAEYPDFSILSEESDPIDTGSPYTWILDPLDGSRNYASGIPHVAVVVALSLRGEVVLGVTYDPMREEVFTAEKGKGAYLSGRPISVSPRREMPECILGFDMGYVDEKAVMALELVKSLWPGMQSIRVMGSGALGLAYAACGRLDLYFHHQLAPWDIASGLLLVSEAGGRVVDKHGDPATLESVSVIGSSNLLLDQFLSSTEGLEWRR